MTLRKLHSTKILGAAAAFLAALSAVNTIGAEKPRDKPAEKAVFQADKAYDLPALLNLALSNNPYTKQT